MKQIVLLQEVRVFIRQLEGKPLLIQAGKLISANTEVSVGDPCMLTYDHQDQSFLPLLGASRESFLLESEALMSG